MNSNETVLVFIESQKVGFLISVANILSESYRVVFLARDRHVKRYIENSFTGGAAEIVVKEESPLPVATDDIIRECLERERKYGEYFSMISSYDRALGKGYIFNADRHPDIGRSWWSLKKKYREILKEFLFFEDVFTSFYPFLILGETLTKVSHLVARQMNIPYLSLGMVRYGLRFFWVETEHYENMGYARMIRENVERNVTQEGNSSGEYEQERLSKILNTGADYTYKTALKTAVMRVVLETYRKVRGTDKKDSYRFLGWLSPILRKPYAYKYLCRHGKSPGDLGEYDIVFFPLHQEPEAALLSLSPEFNNSMELIAWVSKSLPADTVLVVKEQPSAFGIRSRHYYDNLRRIANVEIAHPEVNSWEWIKAARVVTTITGTAGIEAVYFEKPVLSFGRHQPINHLPTVRFSDSFDSTRRHLPDLLRIRAGDERLKTAREAFRRAQMDISFDLPGAVEIFPSKKVNMDLARIAVDKLYEQFPGIFVEKAA